MAEESEIDAVREELSAFLKAQLVTQFPTLQVLPSWPSGAVLPEYAILVQATGEADISMHKPVTVSVIPTTSGMGLVTYQYGYAEEIQLSLDAWASSKSARRTLALAIRRAMNQAPQLTLAVPNALPVFAHQANVSIPVTGLYGAVFTYRFLAVPTVDENAEIASKNEWRSHWRGTADGPLWEQDTMVLMQKLIITGQLGPGQLGATADNQLLSAQRPALQTALFVVPSISSVVHGQTLQLKAYAVYAGGAPVDVTALATWMTGDATKATVGASTGLVTGVAAGTVSITASIGAFLGSCALTVG